MKITHLAAILLITLTVRNSATAQGCSDAGFCTIGNLHQLNEVTHKQKFSLFLPAGVGDAKVFVFAPGIQYDNQLNNRWAIQGKLTGNFANGSLGTASGPGDIFLSGIFTIKKQSNWVTSILLGTKLPLNSGNLQRDGRSLPMQYQSSLGTIDLISGISTSNKNFQFAFGWQQPLSGSNKNEFIPGVGNMIDTRNYPPSRQLNRKGDMLLRGAYTFKPTTALSLNGGLLAIYHLGKDTYKFANDPLIIQGSEGLTLNLTLAASLKLNNKIAVALTAGNPLIAREVRPDGLTRKFVISPEISWNF